MSNYSLKRINNGTKCIAFINYFYLLFIGLTPVVYSKLTVDPTLTPRFMYFGVFLTVFAFFLLVFRKTIKYNIYSNRLKLILLFLIFIGLGVVSLIRSLVWQEGVFVLIKFTFSFLFILITETLLRQKILKIKSLAQGVLMFLFVTLFYFGIDFFTKNEISDVTGHMANKNLLSSITYLSLVLVTYFFFTKDIKKWFFSVLFVLGVLAIIVLQSKAVLGALLIAAVLFVLFSVKQIKAIKKTPILIFGASSFSFLLAVIYVFRNKLPHIFNSNTIDVRFKVWKKTGLMIKDHFVFGVGPGNWKFNLPHYGLQEFSEIKQQGQMIFQRAHNEFLSVFAEFGIIGMLAYCLFFVFIIKCCYAVINSFSDKHSKQSYIVLLVGVIGFMFISFVDFPLERMEHQLLFSIIIVLVLIKTSKVESLKFNLGLPVLLVVPCALFALFLKYKGETHTLKLYVAHKNGNWTEMISLADKSNNVFYIVGAQSVPVSWYKGVGYFSLGDVDKAFVCFNDAYSLSPYNVHVINNLASVQVKKGNDEQAEKLYKEALRISPKFTEARLNYAAHNFNIGNINSAFEIINGCDFLTSNNKYLKFLNVILGAKKLEDKRLSV